MKYTKLGSTGTIVSKFALGTMYVGSETSQDDAFVVVEAFMSGRHVHRYGGYLLGHAVGADHR